MTALTRRRFLAATGACAAGAALPVLHPQVAFAADGSSDHTLVVVLLGGGLDALSAVVPAGDSAYGANRSATAVGNAAALDGMFGLHPALNPLWDLWSAGHLAVIPAIGTVTGTRSHFAEMASVASGAAGYAPDGSGWLARHLLTRSGGASTLAGVSTGGAPALELTGHPGAFDFTDVAVSGLTGWDTANLPTVLQNLGRAYGGSGPVLSRPAAVAFEALGRLDATGAAGLAAAIPDTDPWVRQLRQIAQLALADIGMEAAVLTFNGFDTHRYQAATLATLLDRLARGLAAMAADLHGQLHRTTIVVLSEFGRRVKENASAGTDHGRGGVAFVLGDGINGGIKGTWPGLDDASLDQGDLAVTTDVRSVLAEVVAGRLGNPALDRVFPGFTPTSVGLV